LPYFLFHYSTLIFFFYKIGFMFFFIFLSIKLSQSHDLTCGFGRLTRVYSHLFFSFNYSFFLLDSFVWLIFLILSFNIWFIKNWVSWFFHIWCFRPNGPCHKFYKLTMVLKKIRFHDFFHFSFYRVTWSHNQICGFGMLTRVSSSLFMPYNC